MSVITTAAAVAIAVVKHTAVPAIYKENEPQIFDNNTNVAWDNKSNTLCPFMIQFAAEQSYKQTKLKQIWNSLRFK